MARAPSDVPQEQLAQPGRVATKCPLLAGTGGCIQTDGSERSLACAKPQGYPDTALAGPGSAPARAGQDAGDSGQRDSGERAEAALFGGWGRLLRLELCPAPQSQGKKRFPGHSH